MDSHLHLLDEVMDELEVKAIRTSQGVFYKAEDVRGLIDKRKEATAVDKATLPTPKTMEEARSQAKKFLADALPSQGPKEPGRSISATEPHPPSRA